MGRYLVRFRRANDAVPLQRGGAQLACGARVATRRRAGCPGVGGVDRDLGHCIIWPRRPSRRIVLRVAHRRRRFRPRRRRTNWNVSRPHRAVDPVADFRSCYTDSVLVNGVPLTADDLVARACATQAAYSDLRVELVPRIDTGTTLVIAFLMHGRHTGPVSSALGEVAPTGRTEAIRTTDVLATRCGLIEDVWVIADEMDLLRQLGQVPVDR